MTPQEALRHQIEKNERIIALVRADSISGVTAEGRQYKERELREVNSALRLALEMLE